MNVLNVLAFIVETNYRYGKASVIQTCVLELVEDFVLFA